jgi:hypothetical protein
MDFPPLLPSSEFLFLALPREAIGFANIPVTAREARRPGDASPSPLARANIYMFSIYWKQYVEHRMYQDNDPAPVNRTLK